MPPEDADFVWILLLVLETYFTRLILRAVFTNNKFEFEIRLLRHNAFNRLPNVWLVVVGYHIDGYDWTLAKLF